MKKLLPVVLLVLCTSNASATDIKGKWGLGVYVGSLTSSAAEASLIRGKSAKTAWILDLSAAQGIEVTTERAAPGLPPFVPPEYTVRREFVSVAVGPRFRRFTRPDADFSPYWDLYLSALYYSDIASDPRFSSRITRWGGELGTALGIEYFMTRWHCSLAAHSGLGFVRLQAVTRRSYAHSEGTSEAFGMGLSPRLQVRVYF